MFGQVSGDFRSKAGVLVDLGSRTDKGRVEVRARVMEDETPGARGDAKVSVVGVQSGNGKSACYVCYIPHHPHPLLLLWEDVKITGEALLCVEQVQKSNAFATYV